MERQKLQQLELELRGKYGDYFINEANHVCPFPGCGRSLVVTKAGKATNLYNVGLIDEKKHQQLIICWHFALAAMRHIQLMKALRPVKN